MNNLEQLLQERELLNTAVKEEPEDNCDIPHGGTAVNMQRAKKGASLYDFFDMLALIVDYAMADMKVKFITDEDENILKDPELAFEHPYISYRVISRKPKNEYKPIAREEIVECDEHNEQRLGTVRGIAFDCIVQFNVFASENKVANKVMETFEELAESDVARFLYENLKHYDGLETAYVNIDIKLSDFENKASKRDDIIQRLDDAHVSFSNKNQPMIYCV